LPATPASETLSAERNRRLDALPTMDSELNEHIAWLEQRLIWAGKPKKVALVACMRTLHLILNALVGYAGRATIAETAA
jgi:hypothetical protein